MFEAIEKLKREYTDKYVVADASIAELARFEGHVGQVKTVNMNGRALVEFDCWSNIGWYDIELDYLKVVPKPEPQAEGEKPAKHEAAAKPAGAATKTAAAPATGGAKKSTAEILAAARAKKAGAAPSEPARQASAPARAPEVEQAAPAAAEAEPVEEPPAVVEVKDDPAKAVPSKAAFPPGQRPSVDQILAWCREHDAK
ncbi:MAG: hypothetical protein WD063_05540 [Pirellulales bacterium]